ncbi:MAG TPA: DUF3592 domain-containing protein [Steroidobacteraceae bacterium]|nr:DUF3592 domain-containing protein [Steroidobacteraceae bacterium]
MRKFRWIFWTFLGVGALMLVGAALLCIDTRRFIAHAQDATGTVVELREVRSDDGGSTWKPVVRFTAADGRDVTFASRVSSSPPSYDVGETVPVLYRPEEPGEARIRGFGSLWFGASILGGLGLLFAALGGGLLFARRASRKKQHYLMAYGNAVETEFQGVDRNTSVEINGRNPWRITSQWLDPATHKLRIFHSENLWFDPTKFVNVKKVTVLLDPNNPQRYYMDVSFLPEVEGG